MAQGIGVAGVGDRHGGGGLRWGDAHNTSSTLGRRQELVGDRALMRRTEDEASAVTRRRPTRSSAMSDRPAVVGHDRGEPGRAERGREGAATANARTRRHPWEVLHAAAMRPAVRRPGGRARDGEGHERGGVVNTAWTRRRCRRAGAVAGQGRAAYPGRADRAPTEEPDQSVARSDDKSAGTISRVAGASIGLEPTRPVRRRLPCGKGRHDHPAAATAARGQATAEPGAAGRPPRGIRACGRMKREEAGVVTARTHRECCARPGGERQSQDHRADERRRRGRALATVARAGSRWAEVGAGVARPTVARTTRHGPRSASGDATRRRAGESTTRGQVVAKRLSSRS